MLRFLSSSPFSWWLKSYTSRVLLALEEINKINFNILAVLYVFTQYLDHFCGVALTWWFTTDPHFFQIMEVCGIILIQLDKKLLPYLFFLIYLHQTSEAWMLSKETALQLLVIAGTYASCAAWYFYKSRGSINYAHGLVGDHQELLLLDSIVYVELRPSLFSSDNSIIVTIINVKKGA